MTVDTDASPVDRSGEKSSWPPGFRFHPTDEELVLYYLKRKICRRKLRLNIISELDVYKWDPEELPGQSLLKSGDRQWFFFSHRDRKYPNAARSNRATRHGYWKATGKDRIITSNGRAVGVKKTLVFYKGRAPNGERTDWVMHEYTLDEEELKRCQNVQDYYALYKAFKKSGPGPKNGEQYGAPFKEEDWADDDYSAVTKVVSQEICPKQLSPVSSVDNVGNNSQVLPPPNDIEEFFNEIAEGPELEQPRYHNSGYMLPQEEETQSTLVDPSSQELVTSEPLFAYGLSAPRDESVANFELTQLGASQWQQLQEASETCAPECGTLETRVSEDFLEIDDLINSDPSFCALEKPAQDPQFDDFDGFSEFDMFRDADMFLRDIGSMDQEDGGTSQINCFDNGLMNQYNHQQQPPISNAVDQTTSQLWVHEQTIEGYTSAEIVQEVQPCPSGFVNGSSSLPSESSQSPIEEGGGVMSEFSSALWAFVDSIPTTPASASENAIVSRALGRMSSFSRLKIYSVSTDASAVKGDAIVTSGRRGLFLLSVIGVLVAILGVLIGSMRLWERCAS
ncbi:NAC domain-containing protein 17-like [Rhodamnia argentea]|uniref:NAC domain-containing protein 17-like n=1 Tax=Rhodamnia argentea TaxID=178133 RepID=A0A8B8P266_9MYRT|nr:NAC domain-containing protein 17-like [Rhodamnia argentea]